MALALAPRCVSLNNQFFLPVTKGRIAFSVDTDTISVSKAIEVLLKNADITDLSIAGASAEEMVVSLYEEFKI